jgi:hypothetical protein
MVGGAQVSKVARASPLQILLAPQMPSARPHEASIPRDAPLSSAWWGEGMADVFLSYSSADRAKAAALERALSGAGYDVFWDQETPAGADWDAWIRDKLANAKVVIVLWSKASIASPNVRHEAMIARDVGALIPVLIDPLKPTDFPMGLYLVQAISLAGWKGDAADPAAHRVVSEVAARMNRPAPPLPKPRKKAGAVPPVVAALLLAGGGYYFLTSQHAAATSAPNAAPQTPQAFALSLAGKWRLLHTADCSAAFQIKVEGDQLSLGRPRWHGAERTGYDL